MRTALALALALALFAGCASSRAGSSSETVPAPPEFAAQADGPAARAEKPSPAEAASDATTPISPEDQIFFARDSAQIDAEGYLLLGDVANWLMADRTRTVLIRGYADPSGSVDHNLDLSARRAMAAATYLQRLGVPEERINVAAVGEDEATHAPASQNRRVVIFANAKITAQQ